MSQLVKKLPVMWEMWVRSLGWEDPLEKGKTIPFWPGEFRGRPWGCRESDMNEVLSLSLSVTSQVTLEGARDTHNNMKIGKVIKREGNRDKISFW